MPQLFKNLASQKVRVKAFADAGHATLDAGEPVTGDAANITARTALDNAALGASNDTNPAEVDATNAPGIYEFDPTQGETNGNVIEWYSISSTAGVQVQTLGGEVQTLQPPNFPTLGIETDGDLTKVNTLDGHTPQTADHTAAIDAIKVITDAIGATAAARLALSAGQIIPFTVDTVTNTHTPTTTEFQADDITEATADHYNGRVVVFTSGNLAGQATEISDYAAVGGIGQFTVVEMTEAPANNDTGIII